MPIVKPAARKAPTVRSVLMSCREHYAFAALFTMLFSLLMLSYPIFMMQVYQRVIPANSWETLVTLCIGLLIALAAKAAFQWVRGLLLVRVSARIEKSLADPLLRVVIRQSANGTGPANASLLRDLDSVRQFASGKGAVAILDVPFGLMFLAVLFALDATIGMVALILEAILTVVTVINNAMTKRAILQANLVGASSQQFSEAAARTGEAVVGLGMLNAVVARWRQERDKALQQQAISSNRGVAFSSVISSARIAMQGAIVVVGSLQVMGGHIPAG
ncbi:MAG: ABC transporter transmembrane domain-containing protein, partial [Microvirga sp.]